MLFKEKKPNEYTEGRRGEHTETDTHHKAQAGSAQAGHPGTQAGTWWRGAEGQAGSLGAAHAGNGPDGTGLGKRPTVRGAWHLMETRPGPADTATGA